MVDLALVVKANTTGSDQVRVSLERTAVAADAAQTSLNGVSAASDKMAMEAARAAKQQAIMMGAANDNIRLTKGQMQGLGYQINDIGTMLAMGASPFQILASQGGQVLQLLGDGPGGITGSLKALGVHAMALAVTFSPLLLIIGAIALAIGGMTAAINEASDVQVNFGDTALAVWQVIGGGIYQFIKPAVDAIGGWFGLAWDAAVKATRTGGNSIINEVRANFELIKATVLAIPDAFIVAGQAAANGFLDGIEQLVKMSMEKLNGLLGGFNAMAGQIGFDPIKLFDPSSVDLGNVNIGGADAQARLDAGWKGAATNIAGIRQEDPMGDLFGAIQQQSIANATARLAENEDAVSGVASAAEKAAASYGDLEGGAARFIERLAA